MKSAVLVHLLEWGYQSPKFELGDGIELCCLKGSKVENLYNKLCEIDKVDEGEPFHYPSYILIPDSAHDDLFSYWGGPFSIISQCCNMISLCTSYPIGMCRLITSRDDFNTSWATSIIYEPNDDLSILTAYPDYLTISTNGTVTCTGDHFQTLDEPLLRNIATCWNNYLKLSKSSNIDNHRVKNALSYFFYSWRSYYLEHVCLNLSIVIETLFSPSSSQELSHQIAFNASHYFGKDANEREVIYSSIKRFYNIRSQIVHGGKAKFHELAAFTPEVFHICAKILKSILIDYTMAQCFCNETDRNNLFKKWLFGV